MRATCCECGNRRDRCRWVTHRALCCPQCWAALDYALYLPARSAQKELLAVETKYGIGNARQAS